MLALDTNLLVRLMTNDDTVQADQVEAVLNQELAAGRECWVGLLVMAELVWVLSRAYGYRLSQCQEAVDQLIAFAGLRFENTPVLLAAVQGWRLHGGDLADHIIGHQMQSLGCTAVLSFDKKAAKLKTHRLLT